MTDRDRPLETLLNALAPPAKPAARPAYAERIAVLEGIAPPTTGLADFPPGDAIIREHLVAAGGHIVRAQHILARLLLIDNTRNAVKDLRDALLQAIDHTEHASAALRLQALANELADV